MSGSFEKSVKGGTKIKLAAPKSKYVEHILTATRSGEAGVAEVFRTLSFRLRDSTWTIVFKSLIIIHLMIREGEPQVTLRFLADQHSKMAISSFSDAQVQGPNIRHYYNYLLSRVKAYHGTKTDWVRDGQNRLRKQTVDKGLLRETEVVQKQLTPLLKCELFSDEPENEISLTAFRLLIMDLLALFKVMNEGMVNVLEHYFEMSKTDAGRALQIYRTFIKQTEMVVSYLHVARQHEHATRLEIPTLKHAPTTLLAPLEEYIKDPDFETNRRQYLAQRDGKALPSKNDGPSKSAAASTAQPSQSSQAPQASQPETRGPAPDLMDFFESIEQNQQPMQTQPQQNGNPYQFQQQPQFQGQPQQAAFPSTNPFAQMVNAQQQPQQQVQQPQQQNFNPFAQQPQQQPGFNTNQLQSIPQSQQASFTQQQPFQSGQQQGFADQQPQSFQSDPQQAFNQQQQPQPFQNDPQQAFNPQQQPFFTGQSQPFSATSPQQQQISGQGPFGQGLQPAQTGQQSTNPFRQSMMPSGNGTGSSPFNSSLPFASPPQASQTQQSTNPFARNVSGTATDTNSSPFFSAPPTSTNTIFNQGSMQPPPQQNQPMQPLQSAKTGTNPFARSAPTSTLTSPIIAQPTGTNPFRQSAFVNQQTGQGWQVNQGTMGGLEQVPTIPIFPRPQGQQPQPWP